jgi:hypothetical protein
MWQRLAVYNLLLLSLVLQTAHAGEQGAYPEPAAPSVSRYSHEIGRVDTDQNTALKDEELAPVRGRGIDLPSTFTCNNIICSLVNTYDADFVDRGSRKNDVPPQDKGELELARLDDSELGQVKGGAFETLVPDLKNHRIAAIILWDEVKTKRNVSMDQVQMNGPIISTISTQGR